MPVDNIFQIRRGSETQWVNINPVLASGEPGYDLTNNILKIGDGVTSWNNLRNSSSISGLITASSGQFNSLTLNNIPVSVSGHTHTSNNITDFNSSVSGLLPTIANSGNNRVLTSVGNSFDINAESNLTFDGSLLSVNSSGFFTSGIFLGSQSSIGNIGGQYISFEEGVIFLKRIDNSIAISLEEDMLFSDNGGASLGWSNRWLYGIDNNVVMSWAEANKIGILNLNPQYTLDVTGSGNFSSGLYVNGTGVSVSGHTHLANNITNFNSSVSGLLPVKNILAGTNISINNTAGDYTISVSGSLGLTTEEVDDRVASLLVAGSGINLSYNDNSNSLTISTLNNKILSDVVGSTNYIGVAPYNSLSSAEVWKIYKTIYLSDGGVSSNTSANNVAWDNRYSVTYS